MSVSSNVPAVGGFTAIRLEKERAACLEDKEV